jgi:hypothetical protein
MVIQITNQKALAMTFKSRKGGETCEKKCISMRNMPLLICNVTAHV